jgi:hypothetical protein
MSDAPESKGSTFSLIALVRRYLNSHRELVCIFLFDHGQNQPLKSTGHQNTPLLIRQMLQNTPQNPEDIRVKGLLQGSRHKLEGKEYLKAAVDAKEALRIRPEQDPLQFPASTSHPI